jgi:hypothetical protein
MTLAALRCCASPSLTPASALTGAFRISASVLLSNFLSSSESRFISTATGPHLRRLWIVLRGDHLHDCCVGAR